MPDYYILDDDNNIINAVIADEDTKNLLSGQGTIVTPEEYQAISPALTDEPIPEYVPARVWTQSDVRSGLTLAEKTVWDNESAPEVLTAKIEIGGGLEEAAITEVLDFLVAASVISADSKTAVLA
jgi:hypothetical protein